MPLERLLQINIAALVAMGSLLLGMGQANRIVPLLAVGSALTSLMLTDIWRLVRLNTMVANIAGIVAVVVCLSDFFEYDRAQRSMSRNCVIFLIRKICTYFNGRHHIPNLCCVTESFRVMVFGND